VLKKDNPGDFELWYGLSELYQKRGETKKAHDLLSEWLRGNPSHQYAAMVSQQLQFMEGQLRNPGAPALPAPDSASVGPDKTGVPGKAEAQPAAASGIPGLAPAGAVQSGPPSGPKPKDSAAKASKAAGKS
jgi:hypothetical protein